MNTLLALFSAALLPLLLCSCAATSVKQSWKSPNLQQPVGKIAVVAVADNGLVRQGFENRLVRDLGKRGAAATVTFDQLSLQEIKQDKRLAAERFLASGAAAVLILRPKEVVTNYRETQPGGERYAGTVTGLESTGWYDYYSVGFMSMSPTYGNLRERLFLEAALYDLKTEKCLWSGVTQTVVKEDTDRIAEADPLVAKIVAAMQKDGAIR